MSGQAWTINSEHTKKAFLKSVTDAFEEHKYITYAAPRIGPDRSLDQNALLHVWLTEYAAHLLTKHKKEIAPGELEGIKRHAKGEYYRRYSHPFIIHVITNPKTGQARRDYTSSKSWKKGEMFHFLTWLQMTAAQDGLVLESKGQFAKLQREHEQQD